MEDHTRFVICGCHSHGMSIDWDDENEPIPQVYLGMWYRGTGKGPLLARIGWAWHVLRTGHGQDELLLDRDAVLQTIAALEEAAVAMRRPPLHTTFGTGQQRYKIGTIWRSTFLKIGLEKIGEPNFFHTVAEIDLFKGPDTSHGPEMPLEERIRAAMKNAKEKCDAMNEGVVLAEKVLAEKEGGT